MIHRNPIYVDQVMELLNPVVDALLGVETRRLTGVLQELLVRNSTLGGHRNAFVYNGEFFHILPRRHFRCDKIAPIHPSLEDQAEQLRELLAKLEHDRKRLRQALAVVIPKCCTKQELRDVLPETLAAAVPEFGGMERQREEGFILARNPTLKRQYDQAVEIALHYQANQLIY